eukprot:TRINITY_DN193_c0_g3_i1.p1 TRINITY_DN193_c0_g3~~TRINITY_DN193_c0_g3_i1.p1  ORF type:complete len:552 (+),score=310.27 TRINITY_DN193_c0_g3_i1:167-1822(+)
MQATKRQPNFLPINGTRLTGSEVRAQNVTAVAAISNIVKTSLGPVGLDKMIVDSIGDVTITNDGATILRLLEVEHPAAKVLVELAGLQDQEVGDGTTSVVIIAAELLKRADELLKNKIHPTSIIAGYRLASKEACKYINEVLSTNVDSLGKETLVNVAKTSMSSKIIGGNDVDFFSNLAVDAMQRVKVVENGKIKCSVNSVNILKSHGKSARESLLVEGFALNCTMAAQGMPRTIKNAKIACLDINLNKTKMSQGVQVLLDDPTKLDEIQKRESDITKERIQLILKAGANVILTTKGIDDMCLKYFIEAGAMAVRRCKKEDLRKIAQATGATLLLSLSNLEGEESFDAANLGSAEEISQERISDQELILIKGCKYSQTASIILRGANSQLLEEMDRSLHDSLCVIKRTLESGHVVPGGGAVEAALSICLENFATTLASREQLAIAQFAEALLVIPKTLAVNAAHDATDLVAKLRAYHNVSQTDSSKKNLKNTGLDLNSGKVRDNLLAGVVEPSLSKVKSIQFATEAAITILRIDEMIKLDPKEDPKRDEDY